MDRERLAERLELRIQKMFAGGLLDELCSRSGICAESIATWRAETSEVVNTSPLTPNRKRQAQERQAALLPGRAC